MDKSIVLFFFTIILSAVSLASSAEANPFARSTIWKGSITQGTTTFPATFNIEPVHEGRLKGEITFSIDGNKMKLAFQGALRNVGGQRIVAIITDKVSGDVTYPGLYVGSVQGNTLAGTWEVPSAGQFDTFAVKLVE